MTDPVPHDPWLREALRHAPDADAAPPPKLNDTILRMGRAAVAPRPAAAPPRPPTLAQRLLTAWDWLARPPVAAGFASVLVATVVGVMWWGRPIEDALPPREASAPDTRAVAPPVAAAPVPEAPPAPPARTAEAAKPAEPLLRSTPAQPEPALRKSAPPAAATPAPPPPAPSPVPPAARPAAPPVAPPVAQAIPERPAAPAVTAPAPSRDSAAERNAAPAAEEGVRLRGFAERRELAGGNPPAATAPGAAGTATAPTADAAAPPSALGALRQRAAAGTIETPGLSNLRFEIPRRQADWTWQRNDGPARPVDEAMTNWIALADRTSRPHWNPGSAAGEGAVATLRFTRDGVVRAILRVGPKGLRLDRGGKTESAELSAAQANTLISALETLGP